MPRIALFILLINFFACPAVGFPALCYADEVKEPNVAGAFYPDNKDTLAGSIDSFITQANPQVIACLPDRQDGSIFCLISPHAGHEFSGPTAAYGYKLIKGAPYKTVIILGPSHYYGFKGVSVYASGKFRTPLGDVEIDSEFAKALILPAQNIDFIPQAFTKEHSIEVQLPFLQRTLGDFKLVPIVLGDCGLEDLNNLADALVKAIGGRKDVLLVASTDLTHSYDYQETEIVDKVNLSYLEKMSPEVIYAKLKEGVVQMCGGYPVVAAMLSAKKLNYPKLSVLHYTNSAEVSGKKTKGVWTVGYACAIIYAERNEISHKPEGDACLPAGRVRQPNSRSHSQSQEAMLNTNQKKRLLEIARKAIEEYLANGKRLDFNQDDPQLKSVSGAFVTLHKRGELRGCIGNIIGERPLWETVRDMAIASATGDPRFPALSKEEFKEVDIEISVLTPLKRITGIDEFQLGIHGVMVKSGWNQGVFLPQVATETGWSKEEFLSYLCSHKAGLAPDAWKDSKTELYIFSALVFSENETQNQ